MIVVPRICKLCEQIIVLNEVRQNEELVLLSGELYPGTLCSMCHMAVPREQQEDNKFMVRWRKSHSEAMKMRQLG